MDNISLIPKKEKEKEVGLARFVSFQPPKIEFSAVARVGLGVIAVVLILTGGLYFWKLRLAREVESFNGELQRLTSQRDMNLENRLKNLNNVLEIFKGVLDEHRYWSLAFKMLEEKTLNTITFKTLETDESSGELLLSGSAPSYGALAQQVKIFEDTPHITAAVASDVGVNEGGKIKFSLKINLAQDLIRKK